MPVSYETTHWIERLLNTFSKLLARFLKNIVLYAFLSYFLNLRQLTDYYRKSLSDLRWLIDIAPVTDAGGSAYNAF